MINNTGLGILGALIIGALVSFIGEWEDLKAVFRWMRNFKPKMKMFLLFFTKREWAFLRLCRTKNALSKQEYYIMVGKTFFAIILMIIFIELHITSYFHEFCHFIVGIILGNARIIDFNTTEYYGKHVLLFALAGPLITTLFYALITSKSPGVGFIGMINVMDVANRNSGFVYGWTPHPESDIGIVANKLSIDPDLLNGIIIWIGIIIFCCIIVKKIFGNIRQVLRS